MSGYLTRQMSRDEFRKFIVDRAIEHTVQDALDRARGENLNRPPQYVTYAFVGSEEEYGGVYFGFNDEAYFADYLREYAYKTTGVDLDGVIETALAYLEHCKGEVWHWKENG